MSMRIHPVHLTLGVMTLALAAATSAAWGQTAPAPAAKAPPAATGGTATIDAAARKSEILASTRWRRAMFELNEWLSGQQIYTPQQVEKLKRDFTAKVNRESADELELTLADLEAKFQIMQSPQAQDARTYLARYLSILSDKKREELLSKLPNIETMTAGQLQQTIARIEGRVAANQQQATEVEQLRNTAANPWTQSTKMAEQAYMADHSGNVGGYVSPYSPGGGTGKRPFEGIRTGPQMSIYSGGYGGAGIIMGLGGW